jgi:type VI protein secretion system component Hcp
MLKGAAGLGAATAVASVLTTSYTASAAVNIDGSLDGIGEFQVLAVSWGVSQNAGSTSASGRSRSRATAQDVSLTKFTDGTSVGIVEAIFVGRSIARASVTVSPTGELGDSITFDLENVMVSSYSGGGSGGEDRLTENVTLAYETLTYTVNENSAVYSRY